MNENIQDKTENKKVNKKKKNNFNITAVKNERMQDVFTLFNDKLKKLTIIVFAICVVIFICTLISTILSYNNGNTTISATATVETLKSQIYSAVFLVLVIIIAGSVPIFPVAVIGVFQACTMVSDMLLRYAFGISYVPTLFIGGVIQLVGVSLSIAIGLYYNRLSTKKNKYNKASSFTFDDVKAQVYEIRKNNKKVEELNKKKQEKIKKMEENNVKIPYLNFAILGLIACVFEIVGIVISKI